jgi:hypothetical protein
MSDGGGDIIIKGGSCEIHFDDALFRKDPNDPSRRAHKHDTYRITRIVISGDADYDTGFPKGFKGEIRITCEP